MDTTTVWPDLQKDAIAIEAAKVVMGWSDMTVPERMASTSRLVRLAQEFKDSY